MYLRPELVLFPTFDPIIARHIGSALQAQREQGSSERLQIRGSANQAPVHLDIFEAQEGYRVRGHFAGAVVDHTITDDTRPFDDNRTISLQGRIGAYPISVQMQHSRRETPVKHSKSLENKATLTGRSRLASTAKATFGGAALQTNLAPTEFPENSPPIKTCEETRISGHLNGLPLERFHRWNTTSWTNSYNDDSGAINWEDYRIEEAEQDDRIGDTSETVRFKITPGSWAVAQGTLQDRPYRREYLVVDNGIRVQHSLGEFKADYEILHA